ncbi:MAG: hypothetical protein EBT49_09515 [Betaproteobacteria bacterium]|nr:hypothetical protein [Betaproteobacteria bacterium]
MKSREKSNRFPPRFVNAPSSWAGKVSTLGPFPVMQEPRVFKLGRLYTQYATDMSAHTFAWRFHLGLENLK